MITLEHQGVKKGLRTVLSVFFGGVLLLPYFAMAQAPAQGGFVLEPGRVEVFMDPGETAERTIAVTNRESESVTFKIEFEDLSGSEDPSQAVVLLGDEVGPYSLKDYVSVPETEFTLEPGEKKMIPVSISIPSDSEPGGHYGAVIVSNSPTVIDEETEATGATIVSRLGALFFVRVNGEANESGSVESFGVKGGSFFVTKKPYMFEILFRNTGNVHLTPYGYISIKNLFGREIASVPIDAYFSLPQSLRSREIEWGEKTLFGIYKADLELNKGYNDLIDTHSVHFVALPWKLLSLALLGILVLSSLLYFVTTRLEIKRK